jgi:NAD(P)-dependent dehydrogenase (short-subunit alcohol dehydrogenase family)
MSGLEGFRLLVTGGGSGIGRAIVLGASGGWLSLVGQVDRFLGADVQH